MALYFFILLTLLKLALCLPDPNFKIGIDIDVDDTGCGGGGCNKKSCSFGGTVWSSGSILTKACFKLKCVDGTWKYTPGDIDPKCGECKLAGDPHITTFDQISDPYIPKYLLNGTGEYVATQPGFVEPGLYYVYGTFEECDWWPVKWGDGACIRKAIYHQPGITITLILPPSSIAKSCEDAANPARSPDCDIKVSVDNTIIPIGNSVKYFTALSGPILVFKHNDIGEVGNNLNCITIVGSEGISVSLCEYKVNYPYFYIWAMPSLKSGPSTLHGLCNTYTGGPVDYFVLQNTTHVSSESCLNWITKPYDAYEICDEFSNSWKNPKHN